MSDDDEVLLEISPLPNLSLSFDGPRRAPPPRPTTIALSEKDSSSSRSATPIEVQEELDVDTFASIVASRFGCGEGEARASQDFHRPHFVEPSLRVEASKQQHQFRREFVDSQRRGLGNTPPTKEEKKNLHIEAVLPAQQQQQQQPSPNFAPPSIVTSFEVDNVGAKAILNIEERTAALDKREKLLQQREEQVIQFAKELKVYETLLIEKEANLSKMEERLQDEWTEKLAVLAKKELDAEKKRLALTEALDASGPKKKVAWHGGSEPERPPSPRRESGPQNWPTSVLAFAESDFHAALSDLRGGSSLEMRMMSRPKTTGEIRWADRMAAAAANVDSSTDSQQRK